MNDQIRAGIIAFVQSVFPVLVILNIVELSDVQQNVVILCINNGLTLAMLLWKEGQQRG